MEVAAKYRFNGRATSRRLGMERLESRRVLASALGSVFEDSNADGTRDGDEPGMPGVVVYLDANGNGQLDQIGIGLEPDDFAPGQTLDQVAVGVVASETDGRSVDPIGSVTAIEDSHATTGLQVFGANGTATWDSDQGLRIDFSDAVDSLTLDVVGAAPSFSDVQLEAYTSSGQLVGADTILDLENSVFDRLSITRPEREIDFVVAQVTNRTGGVRFDNLRANAGTDEISTLSGRDGFYRLFDFDPGEVVLRQIVPTDYEATVPGEDQAHVVLIENAATNLNFGNRTASLGGIAFHDTSVRGAYEPGNDESAPDLGLFLDINGNGTADAVNIKVDPDSFLQGQNLAFAVPGLHIRAADEDNRPLEIPVTASSDDIIDPDGKIFTSQGEAGWNQQRRLFVEVESPAAAVEIDFVGASTEEEIGTLLAFSRAGELIAEANTDSVGLGQRQTLRISRSAFDIHAIAAFTSSPGEGAGRLDNLSLEVIAEPISFSDATGEFLFKPLSEGTYRVGALPPTGRIITFPVNGVYVQQVEVGDAFDELHFGIAPENRLPVAVEDEGRTVEDTPVAVGVLVNDFDTDGFLDPGSIAISRSPLHGTAEVTFDGQIVYTPEENFHGTDTLIYTVRDDKSAESNSAVVLIQIASVNDSPEADDDVFSILPGQEVFIDVLSNDRDVDNEIDPTSVSIISPPSRGQATVDGQTGVIRYVPGLGGDDSFRYTVQDRLGIVSNVATVSINAVRGGVAPVAVDDQTELEEGTPATVKVLENDRDQDGLLDPASLLIVQPPTRGTASVDPTTGTIRLAPSLGFVGNDQLQYIVRDDSGLTSAPATVSFAVRERDFPYQNPLNSMDVNNDGLVVPRDSLLIINEINIRSVSDRTTSQITQAIPPQTVPAGYVDVNGDGFVTPLDVLWVVNFLNSSDDALGAAREAASDDLNLVAAAILSDGDDNPRFG